MENIKKKAKASKPRKRAAKPKNSKDFKVVKKKKISSSAAVNPIDKSTGNTDVSESDDTTETKGSTSEDNAHCVKGN